MKYLCVDWGKKKIGLAVSDGSISEPWKVIRYDDQEDGLRKIVKAIEEQNPQVLVFGLSEGNIGEETKNFARKLEEKTSKKIIFQDESLSTQTAQKLSISVNINRKKRKAMEDAYSASLILQDYLDGLK